jgi:hypothetical protein
MDFLNLLAWMVAPTEKQKGDVWKLQNPGKNYSEYTKDLEVKKIWKMAIGKIFLWMFLPGSRLLYILKHPKYLIYKYHRWRWSQQWKKDPGYQEFRKYYSMQNLEDGSLHKEHRNRKNIQDSIS